MKISDFFCFFLLLSTTSFISAQSSQIKVLVKSNGKALDSVNIEIRITSGRISGITDIDGEYSTSDNYSSEIKAGERFTIFCSKQGYETDKRSGNFGSDNDELIFDFDLKPVPKVDPYIYIRGEVLNRSNGSTIEDVSILVLTKKRKIKVKTGFFGEFLLKISSDELLSKEKVYIQLKKENYIDEKVSLNISHSESQSIYMNRLLGTPIKIDTPTKQPAINYIPIVGNFYRNENLSGSLYSIGIVSSVGIITNSSIQIPKFEKSALEAISSAGVESFSNKAEFHRNLRTNAYVFSGVLIGTSFIHSVINSNKEKAQSSSSLKRNFRMNYSKEGIGFVLTF